MTEQKMFKEYNEIIDKMLWKHNRNLWDDLRSEAYIQFTYVRDNYDPNKGSFFSMAYRAIEMQMLNFIRKETCTWARKNTYNSLNNYVGNDGDRSIFAELVSDYGNDFEENFMMRDVWEKNLNSGNEFARTVKRLYYVEGYSIRDINASLGLKFNNPRDKERLHRALLIKVN